MWLVDPVEQFALLDSGTGGPALPSPIHVWFNKYLLNPYYALDPVILSECIKDEEKPDEIPELSDLSHGL